jgi:hypothetical protein
VDQPVCEPAPSTVIDSASFHEETRTVVARAELLIGKPLERRSKGSKDHLASRSSDPDITRSDAYELDQCQRSVTKESAGRGQRQDSMAR